jgi:hypothetical protein
LYQNFGAADAPDSATTYEWTATNATVWATGSTGQYALVNFTEPGTAVVTLTASMSNGCIAVASETVTVGSGTSDIPNVIYVSSHFVCLQSNVASFQWGFDDAVTLDSTIIPGAIDQSYFVQSPDIANKNYWVITKTGDGCMKKTYYNAPTGVTDVNNVAELKVYPNPATSAVNVEVSTTVSGDVRFEIVNMLGQRLNTVQANDRKALINVADLSTGHYIIDCYIGDIKIGTAKFIKY